MQPLKHSIQKLKNDGINTKMLNSLFHVRSDTFDLLIVLSKGCVFVGGKSLIWVHFGSFTAFDYFSIFGTDFFQLFSVKIFPLSFAFGSLFFFFQNVLSSSSSSFHILGLFIPPIFLHHLRLV